MEHLFSLAYVVIWKEILSGKCLFCEIAKKTEDMLRVTRGPNYTLFFNRETRAKNSLSCFPVHQIWQKHRWATKQTAWRCCYPLVLFLEASLWCCSSDCKMVSVPWQVKSSEPNRRISSILGKCNAHYSIKMFFWGVFGGVFCTKGLKQSCAATTASAALTSLLTSQHMQHNMYKSTSVLQ